MWLGGLVVSAKFHLRGDSVFLADELSGFLKNTQINNMSKSRHPCLYAADELRNAMNKCFLISPDTSDGIAASYSSIMRYMETSLDLIICEMGGLERVKSTPLPIVYVTHLRTFLLVYLLSLPYVYGHTWGWGTIPAVFITGYALLGIDGAAAECESPFKKNRPNHLDMEFYCLTALSDLEEIVIHHANISMR